MSTDPKQPQDGTWPLIAEALRELKFGVVTITIHHGRIVQIERSEKLRLDRPGKASSSVPKQDTSVDRVSGNHNTLGDPDHA